MNDVVRNAAAAVPIAGSIDPIAGSIDGPTRGSTAGPIAGPIPDPIPDPISGRLRVQVLLLTGQSDPARCALSPVQRAFLDALPLPAANKVPLNFPYVDETNPWRPTSLLVASARHVRQYSASRRPAFAARHQARVRERLERAGRTLILSGSSGLELLNNLHLPREMLDRLHVFAYGPVARRRPDCDCVLVQGRRDWISRLWFPVVEHRVDCAHMDYLESPEVLALCVDRLRRMVAVSAEARVNIHGHAEPADSTPDAGKMSYPEAPAAVTDVDDREARS